MGSQRGSQPEPKAIEHGEIRRTLSGAIADQELMFEQERFSYDLARSARAEEFREGHEQMDRQEEQIAHELETILPANLHKTRLHHGGNSCQICQFATTGGGAPQFQLFRRKHILRERANAKKDSPTNKSTNDHSSVT